MSGGAFTGPSGLDHRGLLYDDRTSLVADALPWITAALAEGGGVVVVTDRATARELDSALPCADSARVLYPSPSTITTHGSPAFTRNLTVWAASVSELPRGRVFVLTQYAPGPADGIDPSLVTLPITVICACARDADDDALEAFHAQHDVVLRGGTTRAGVPAADEDTTTLEATIGDSADLADVRREIRKLAVGAGFGGSALERTVLAVHEACALACRLLRLTAGTPDPDPVRRCWIEVRVLEGSLRVEVVVPGGADPSVDARHPEEGPTLDHVRSFCHAASVHDGTRSRAIRVLALAG